MLDEKGAPTVVQKTLIRPPASRLGPLSPGERAGLMGSSPVRGAYDQAIDRESAFEVLQARAAAKADQAPATGRAPSRSPAPARAPSASQGRQSMGETFAKQLLRTLASTAGREIMRGVLGGMRRR